MDRTRIARTAIAAILGTDAAIFLVAALASALPFEGRGPQPVVAFWALAIAAAIAFAMYRALMVSRLEQAGLAEAMAYAIACALPPLTFAFTALGAIWSTTPFMTLSLSASAIHIIIPATIRWSRSDERLAMSYVRSVGKMVSFAVAGLIIWALIGFAR